LMPEASPAQSTLKRLIEAEDQAREILKAAEERAQSIVVGAREQAKQSVDAIRQEGAKLLRSRLEAVESQAAIEMKQRLDQAEAQAQEIQRRAKHNSAQAVDMVMDWATFKGK